MAFDFFSRLRGRGSDRAAGGEEDGPGEFLVVGLGNPGRQYAGTRHNVGYMVVDVLAGQLGLRWATAKIFRAQVARGKGLDLAKPLTFMNESGTAIDRIARHHRLKPEQILVVYDDVSLPLGQIRLRAKGSHGGHNGIRDTIRILGTDAFPRLKIGIAPPEDHRGDLSDFVLGHFGEEERSVLEKTIPRATDAVTHVLDHGLESAMNLFNRKGNSPAEEIDKKTNTEQ